MNIYAYICTDIDINLYRYRYRRARAIDIGWIDIGPAFSSLVLKYIQVLEHYYLSLILDRTYAYAPPLLLAQVSHSSRPQEGDGDILYAHLKRHAAAPVLLCIEYHGNASD